MKLLPFIFFLFAADSCTMRMPKDHPPSVNPVVVEKDSAVNRTLFYTDQDTFRLAEEGFDTLEYTKKEFNEIVDYFPMLYNENPPHPDISYSESGLSKKFTDTAGKQQIISFGSEAGQDEYYRLYAYFLRKQHTDLEYETRRKKLVLIYHNINEIFGALNYGGTYFGHQYNRIAGYAAFDVNAYMNDKEYFSKEYSIATQKKYFLQSLRQYITDEVNTESQTITPHDKKERQQELFRITSSIENYISDYFFLKKAQEFRFSYYR